MSKKSILCSLICLSFLWVTAQKKTNTIGGKKDRHGCIKAAGYQWSEIQQSCIRSFELPVQLLNDTKTWSASFLLDQSQNTAEVFCRHGRFMLTKNESGEFYFQKRRHKLLLFKKDNLWTLKYDDEVYLGYLN